MHENKKVIFITGSLCNGGAEKVLSILASGCAEQGADITLVVLREREIIYSVSDKVKLIQIKSNGKFAFIQRIKQLHHIFCCSPAQTVIPFIPIVTLYTVIANIGVGKKIIMSERADPKISIFSKNMSFKDRIGRILMLTLGIHKLASWTVFQTPEAQACYSKKVQLYSCIISNPLDTSKLPQRYVGEHEKRIVAAGRFSEEKNLSMLIEGFSKFYQYHPDYTMTIYGEGKLRSKLEEQIKKLGLSDVIMMPGFSKNLHAQIQRAAMYISTSNHEGISNSMLEALGMGIPTIVTDCPVGGARLFVKTDYNGILISMNDIDALVSGMNKIADDPEYANSISEKAVHIREKVNKEKICEQWLQLV